VILAAARVESFGDLTKDRPKCMVNVGGVPVLRRIVDTYRSAGIKDMVVVRGYKKDAIDLEGVEYVDNDEAEDTHEAYTLSCAADALEGECIIGYGDVLFKKFIPQQLVELDAEFAVMVDANWKESRNRDRYADYVTCSEPYSRASMWSPVSLLDVSSDPDPTETHGEWMGFLKVSQEGAAFLRTLLERIAADPVARREMDMAGLMREIIAAGKQIAVVYTTGNWLDVDSVDDALFGDGFQ